MAILNETISKNFISISRNKVILKTAKAAHNMLVIKVISNSNCCAIFSVSIEITFKILNETLKHVKNSPYIRKFKDVNSLSGGNSKLIIYKGGPM